MRLMWDMSLLKLDHLAVSCEALDAGAAAIEQRLGISLEVQGEHPDMGTHNRLASTGDIYLEVLAINPDAKGPNRPRWFNIDNFSGTPRLTNWILQTDDIEGVLANLPGGFGEPLALQRGDLKWRMAVPKTGILPWDGLGPAIIQWDAGQHPSATLPDCGLRLSRLTIHHPMAVEMAELLGPLMPRDTAQFMPDEDAKLVAIYDGPNGEIRLE
ncbi:VOC family protein [uncultured Litoreibacter sp.]|uniref:VOC family protein n=1 Tax=uncultured Litoreibacter sp. TaxID=1392394 RepID=UPI00262A10A7|nr:VOC family protein [uncultured Litoreibacter sp.]